MKTNYWLILTLTLSTNLFAQDSKNPPAAAPTPEAVAPKAPEPLSKETLDHIAKMTPIFDGKTLNGWIQSPISYNLGGGDISNLASFAKKLTEKSDAISAFLNAQLDDTVKSSLAEYSAAGTNTKAVASALTKNLNKVIAGPSIYEQKRFAGVNLRPETQELLKKESQGQAARLNRMLL